MPDFYRRSDALAQGVTDNDIKRLCRSGDWVRLRQGSFANSADISSLTPEQRHVLMASSVLDAASAPDAALSHVSAALLHGLPQWNLALDRAHVTRNGSKGSRTKGIRVTHASPYDPDEVTDLYGLAVTTPARTIADIGRTTPFEEAVCIADAAARKYGMTSDDVLDILARSPRNPGNTAARRVALFMDGRAESVGESRSRVLLRGEGFEPELQTDLHDHRGNWIARADFYLRDLGVIGEFDGWVKYEQLVPSGSTPRDVIRREKVREDLIRDQGYQVVRWNWRDLDHPERIVDRIRRAAQRINGPTHTPHFGTSHPVQAAEKGVSFSSGGRGHRPVAPV